MRLTKSNQLETIDGKKNKAILGKKKKHFEFSHCPMHVEFAEVISTENSESQDVVLNPVIDWLDKIN